MASHEIKVSASTLGRVKAGQRRALIVTHTEAPMTEHDVLRVAQARVLSLPEARADVCQAAVALKAAFDEDAMRQSKEFWNAVGGVIESVGRLQNIVISGGQGL